jgi:small subunit ribosomal protein S24e
MEIEIVQKHPNALLKRTDVTFKVIHPKEKTPQRSVIRDKLAGIVGSPRDGVIIGYMRSTFGTSMTQGFAKCYPSADDAKKMEPQFLLKRHGLVEAKKEAKAEGAAPPPPPPPPAKKK